MLDSLNGIAVLRTMVEQWVQPLKKWAHLLCDYTEVEDPTCESTEVLEANAITKRVAGLVISVTIIAARNAMEAFSVRFWPNLVSRFPCMPFFIWSCWFTSFHSCSSCPRAPGFTSLAPGVLSAPPRRQWLLMRGSASSERRQRSTQSIRGAGPHRRMMMMMMGMMRTSRMNMGTRRSFGASPTSSRNLAMGSDQDTARKRTATSPPRGAKPEVLPCYR